LLVVPSDSDSGDTGFGDTPLHSRPNQPSGVVYVNPAEIKYSQVIQGMTIAAPAGPDVQVNDPSLDNIQYPPISGDPYPWEFATESETTLAADGSNIVVSYNSSANSRVAKVGNGFYFAYSFASAYSVSHDGGITWRSGFISPPPGSIHTGFDGVVAKDRAGNFYYSTLSYDANGNYGVAIGKSTDHGETFAPAQFVALDPFADKDWMALGPDPVVPSRDNIYVTWSRYTSTNSTLLFSRSTDGGVTWSPARTIFAYADDGTLSGYTEFSNPTVDRSNGRLYVPFLHYGDINRTSLNDHYVRILASDDGGNTFYPLAFNVPGAPNSFVYPKVPAGIYADCGKGGGIRLVFKQGPDIGGGLWTEADGLPRYVHCAWVTSGQPAAVAQNGRLVIAFEASTGPTAGDPASQSEIVALYSKDGGATWFPPFIVAPATANDPQHVHPALALTPNGNTLYVAYHAQDSNEQLRTELATLQVTGGGLLAMGTRPLSSVRFDLPPSNIPSPLPPLKSEDTINFDQSIFAGWALGEYMGLAVDDNGNPIASWGDCRNTWVSPPNGLYPGPHPKVDVFFVRP
jgi:hypothetical protein